MTNAAFSAHNYNEVLPLHDNILVTDMSFDERVSLGGIIIPTDNGKSTGIRPRWAQVYAVGPEQHDVKVGEYICVAHGRWTRGVNITQNGVEYTIRRVDPNDVMMVSDVPVHDETMSTAVSG